MNLGLEGTLVMGAMSGYGVSYLTGSPWLGVLAAGVAGVVLGALHAWLCARPRVNDVAVGIALMLFGIGLAFFLGKPLIGPTAPHLPAISLGLVERVRAGALGAAGQRAVRARPRARPSRCCFVLRRTRWGLVLRTVGESADAARAMGYDVDARAPAGDDGGRLPGRRRRLVPVALLPGQLERGPLERAGADGGRAGDLRALGSRALPLARRCCSAAPARSARRCSRWA